MKIACWPLLLALASSLVLFAALSPKTGMHIDEGPYIIAGRSSAGWIREVCSTGLRAFHKPVVDGWWSYNHEHPPFAKSVFGAADLKLRAWLGPLLAPRVGALLFFLIAQVAVYYLLLPVGRWEAGLGAFSLLAQPQLFFHAVVAALDFPAVSMSLLCLLFFVKGLERRWYAPLCGIAWGLAMACKINGVLLVIPLLFWGYCCKRTKLADNMFWMAVLGPCTLLAVWPWLWHDTAGRILEYLRFHLEHVHEPVYLFGAVFEQAPWHYPLLILGVVTPVSILAAACLALAPPFQANSRGLSWLLWSVAVFSVLAVMPPSVPVYNGPRLFLLAPALLGVLGALSAGKIMRLVMLQKYGVWVKLTVFALFFIPGLIGAISSHPYLSSYYNELAGFRRGAVHQGFDPLPWTQVEPELIAWLEEEFPKGAAVESNSGAATILKSYQQLGLLPGGFEFIENGDLWIVEENLAYSGFVRWQQLRLNKDPVFQFRYSFDHAGQRFLSIYQRRKLAMAGAPGPE